MFPDLHALLAPAVVERLVLLINHVLAAEPQATARMLAHQGKLLRLEIDGWPRWLPDLPALAFRITPAGLLEWCADAPASQQDGALKVDLLVRVPVADVARLASGVAFGAQPDELPALVIEGDARLAADVDWLARNLRWDLTADLERLFGPVVAHQLQRLGSALARGWKSALQTAGDLATRFRAR